MVDRKVPSGKFIVDGLKCRVLLARDPLIQPASVDFNGIEGEAHPNKIRRLDDSVKNVHEQGRSNRNVTCSESEKASNMAPIKSTPTESLVRPPNDSVRAVQEQRRSNRIAVRSKVESPTVKIEKKGKIRILYDCFASLLFLLLTPNSLYF